mmetsp:Transcript_29507/g.68033  ORF Transcript_29507/g.68033 Transcript_29507/m.68033 type:complete len:491 (-) Transcript_29507:49-1521(-)
MMFRTFVASALLVSSAAQLLQPNQAELDGAAETIEQQQRLTLEEAAPQDGFVHPTLCDSSVKQTAGYISAGLLTKYFFWLFESQRDPVKDPLLIWLSGGPGCSSQLALFAENGPCKIRKDGKSTYTNPYSWHKEANVMWVDQPAGVGFSTSFGTHDERGVANNMYTFLQGFYKQFPQYENNAFFLFGESYAGHYVPAIAHRIWQGNKAKNGIHIPLAGIAIGNGLTDPMEQYKWYPEMGHTGGQKEGGHAPANVISPGDYAIMEGLVPACLLGIAACNRGIDPDPNATGYILNATACYAAYVACNFMSEIPYELTGRNPYDMRIKCEHGRLCYDFDMITTYLNQPNVQQELGVSKKWGSCNIAVDLAFVSAGDWMVAYHTLIPDLLQDGIKVLIYAGDVDYICNWLGNKAWTQKLEWAHAADFRAAEDKEWKQSGKTVAKLRTASGFHFMQVYNAGHMVPMDQPSVALDMVNDFLAGNLEARTETVDITV